jgi:hypothetical protein
MRWTAYGKSQKKNHPELLTSQSHCNRFGVAPVRLGRLAADPNSFRGRFLAPPLMQGLGGWLDP